LSSTRDAKLENRNSWLWGSLLVAACILTYANGLSGAYTYDDKAIVRDNPRIRSPEAVRQIFTTSYFGGPPGSGSAYRPLLLLSFAAQYGIHGSNPVFFHAGNVLLHAVATVLLWRLLLSLAIPRPVSCAAALLFAVHPVHVEAVTSMVGRGEIQAAVFVLLYLGAALRVGARRHTAAAICLALACYAAGLLTKESAAVAPALAFLVFLAQAEGGLAARFRFRFALTRGWPLYAASGAVLAGVFALRARVLGGALRDPTTSIYELENPLAPLQALARIGNAAAVLARSIGRVVLPLRLSADESAWSLPVLTLRSPIVLGAVVLLLAAAAVSCRRLPAARCAAFGFLFFFVAFLPTANILFAIGTVFAERLAYLPSAGLCLVLGAFLVGAAADWTEASRARQAALLAVTLLFAGRAAVRNTVWRSDEALFGNSVRTSPSSAKAWYNDGFSALERKDPGRARESERRAIAIYGNYWDAFAVKGHAEKVLGLLPEAEVSYARSVELWPGYENGWFGLGDVREERGDLRGAEDALSKGLGQKPDSLPLAFHLALVRSTLDRASAEDDWRRALAISPGSVVSRLRFAAWLASHGRPAQARQQWREALRREPANLEALRALAESSARGALPLAAYLAREKVWRLTKTADDRAACESSARSCPACEIRWRRLSATWQPAS
jgi:tetratricopeptide (TPR) repeat protein